jgi:hypothetical protein
MRKKALARIVVFLALGALLMGAKCPGVPSTEEIAITLVTEEYIEFIFQARGEINVDSGVETIDVADIREDLLDAGVDLSSVEEIRVSAVKYGTVAYNEPATDRLITGTVTIERLDNATSETLVPLQSQNVYELLGILVPAPIDEDGIDYLNDLMAAVLDAIQTGFPEEFEVRGSFSGTSSPTERETNFDWRVRFYFHISGTVMTEVPAF